MSTPLLAPLATWAAGLDGMTLSPACNQAIANTALDWAGAAIAGTAHPLHARYVSAFAACGSPSGLGRGCTVMGDDRAWPPAEAGAANAAISHFWEFDDAHRVATMHPGITVYPAVLALAQARGGVDAGRMRAAVVAGYEVGIRIGAALGKQHYAVSHTTATAGAMGAAAAAARMLGLDAAATLSALGHAGTQAAGLWQFLDDGATDAKAFHGAVAVRNGLTAAFLAEAGIAGAPRILEGPRGMLTAWGLQPPSEGSLVPPTDRPFEITRTTIKGWPVCGQMHSVLDATEALCRRHALAPESIRRVRLDVPSPLLAIADLKRPATVSQMKFSTTFCVALLLKGGALPFTGLDESCLRDETVQALADTIAICGDPAFDARFPKERPARITVWTADGAVLTEERSFRRGDPEQPWAWEPLVERFRTIAGLAGTSAAAQDRVIRWCQAFGRGDAVDARADALFHALPLPARA